MVKCHKSWKLGWWHCSPVWLADRCHRGSLGSPCSPCQASKAPPPTWAAWIVFASMNKVIFITLVYISFAPGGWTCWLLLEWAISVECTGVATWYLTWWELSPTASRKWWASLCRVNFVLSRCLCRERAITRRRRRRRRRRRMRWTWPSDAPACKARVKL